MKYLLPYNDSTNTSTVVSFLEIDTKSFYCGVVNSVSEIDTVYFRKGKSKAKAVATNNGKTWSVALQDNWDSLEILVRGIPVVYNWSSCNA